MEEAVKNPPQPPSSEPSKDFKLRVILRDLRPHFLEVLRTDDFRNCKAADEIREQMKILIELFNPKATPENQALPVENKEGQSPQENLQNVTTEEEAGDVKGTYIIGGSAFGWNFVTFIGTDPVYNGVTKETFRANNANKPPQSSH